MKDGSSLVITPSAIPISTTCGLDADFSSEGSEEVLEDSDDEPTMKKRIFDSDEEEGDEHEAETMGTYFSHFLSFPLHLSPLPSFSIFFFICICITS